MSSLKELIAGFGANKTILELCEEVKNRGYYYLGGQIKMFPDDQITKEKIEEVRRIEYGAPANGLQKSTASEERVSQLILRAQRFEAASIRAYNLQLEEIKKIISMYPKTE